MKSHQAEIDGRIVEVRDGDTILSAARRVRVDIPTLCESPDLPAEGGCRMCLVQTNRSAKPVAACHTAIHGGMVVQTDTAKLNNLRRDILSLILSEHDKETFTWHNGDGAPPNEVERLMARLGMKHASFGHHPAHNGIDETHPYLRFDPSLCITCRRCEHACDSIQGQFVYDLVGRGGAAQLVFGPSSRFVDSPCTACGACVDHCPTGAINDRDRVDLTKAESHTDSICGYCGVGCRVRIDAADNRVLRVNAVEDAAVNRGHLCVKGRFAHGFNSSSDRLTAPLLRKDGELQPVSWDEALSWAAERIKRIRREHGPDALGVFTSSRSTNEAAYLFQKLFRSVIGTNNVDCCARVCHSSTALALQLVTGTGAASASYVDIERAKCIVVAGANPTEAHPVVGARIKQAALAGAKLIVIDPRRIELADYADVHLQLRPGTNVMLFNALAKALIESEQYDRAFADERLEGLDELRAFAAKLSLDEAASVTHVNVETIRRAAALLGDAGPTLFVHGLGLSELTQGTASVMTLCNLGMLTGSIGRPGAGMLPLRGQNNVQGNADMGGMPNQVTGYQRVDDPQVQTRLREVWGEPAPTHAGLTTTEMLTAAADGRLRGLWVQGEDIAQSDPNQTHAIAAIEKLDLLVVQDLFLCETAKYAHLVLPAASVFEQEGTFTNGERRIQHVLPAVEPPGEAQPDWQIVIALANALGASWSYETPAEVMDEIARVAPHLFGGVSYERLEGDGLQWPCPAPDHAGTACVHTDGFLRGKGKLVAIDYVPTPEQTESAYPYLLITGRILEHYNVGTMTRRTPNRQLVETDVLELHPDDADALGIDAGDTLHVASRWGETRVPASITERIARGTAFLSFHDPDSHTNRLTSPHVDPQSKCPEYKVTAVRIEKDGEA